MGVAALRVEPPRRREPGEHLGEAAALAGERRGEGEDAGEEGGVAAPALGAARGAEEEALGAVEVVADTARVGELGERPRLEVGDDERPVALGGEVVGDRGGDLRGADHRLRRLVAELGASREERPAEPRPGAPLAGARHDAARSGAGAREGARDDRVVLGLARRGRGVLGLAAQDQRGERRHGAAAALAAARQVADDVAHLPGRQRAQQEPLQTLGRVVLVPLAHPSSALRDPVSPSNDAAFSHSSGRRSNTAWR